MNIFTGKLDIFSTTPVDDPPTLWDISGQFTDYTGLYSALDAQVGDVVCIDGSGFNLGLMRYKIVFIDPDQTSYDMLYCRIQWADFDAQQDPLVGLEGCIGREVSGVMAVPSSAVQFLTTGFTDSMRNNESFRSGKYSFATRIINAPYFGDKDGTNRLFTLTESFVPGTLEVLINGIRMTEGSATEGQDPFDYVLISPTEIVTTNFLTIKDSLVINYNKLV